MTTEEKLQHFHEICMEDAKEHYRRVTEDFEKGLLSSFEEHKEDVRRRQELQAEIAAESIGREVKKELSSDQMKLRREIAQKQEHFKEKLFSEVRKKLAAFRKTEEYRVLLEKQIGEIRSFAGDAEYRIYLDPEDCALFPALPEYAEFREEPFSGGTLAEIPSMNIYIDNSFRTKIEREMQAFRFGMKAD